MCQACHFHPKCQYSNIADAPWDNIWCFSYYRVSGVAVRTIKLNEVGDDRRWKSGDNVKRRMPL
jgi:hypothetical protein